MWTNKVQYLGVYLVSLETLSCNYDLIKSPMVHLMRSMDGKIGTLAFVDVVIELFKTKCVLVQLVPVSLDL